MDKLKRSFKSQKGQSLVEFALILPIVILILMGILEYGLMLNSYLSINNASREGARLGAVGGTDIEIDAKEKNILPTLKSGDIIVVITPSEATRARGESISVAINYNYHSTIPIISNITGETVVLTAQTIMRVE